MSESKKTLTLKEKLMRIQVELKAPKNLYNSFGKYHYRNAEGIQEALKPMEKLYGVFTSLSDKMVEVGGRIYVEATATITDIESAESISVTAYAREALEKKGMDESQITGATSSYARKYALNGLFLLDDTKDTDSEEYQSAGNQTVKKAIPAPKSEPDYRSMLRDLIKDMNLDAASIANACHLKKDSTDAEWKAAFEYACDLVKQQKQS